MDTESAGLPSSYTITEVGLANQTGGLIGDVSWVVTNAQGGTVLEIKWGWSGTSIRYRTSESGMWLCAPSGVAPVDDVCPMTGSISAMATATTTLTLNGTSVLLYVNKQLVLNTTASSLASATRLAVTVSNGTITSFVVTNQANGGGGGSSASTMPVWAWVLIAIGIILVIALIGVAIYGALKKKSAPSTTSVITLSQSTGVPSASGGILL